jgi:hypothetical protein
MVAGGHAQHAAARGERADQPSENAGRVVAVGQGIEHAGGALRAPVAGIRAVCGERHRTERLELFRRCVHQQRHFPVAGVVSECDGRAICRAYAAVGAEDEKLLAAEQRRIPAHTRVLGPAEQVARGPVQQHFGRYRDGALRPARLGLHIE